MQDDIHRQGACQVISWAVQPEATWHASISALPHALDIVWSIQKLCSQPCTPDEERDKERGRCLQGSGVMKVLSRSAAPSGQAVPMLSILQAALQCCGHLVLALLQLGSSQALSGLAAFLSTGLQPLADRCPQAGLQALLWA